MRYIPLVGFVWWPRKLEAETLRKEWRWLVPMYCVVYEMPDGSHKTTAWCTTERLARGYAVQARLRAVKTARK